jgi:phosphoglucosamine mutase
LLAIYLKELNRLLADTVAVTVMRNLGLKQFLQKHGIQVIETPVGDKYIYNALKSLKDKYGDSTKVGLGGEQSGHVMLLDDTHNTGDGMRTALYVIEAFIKSEKRKFSEFVMDLNRTPQIIASAYVGNGNRVSKEELSY